MAMVPVRESANRPTGPDGEFESPAVIMSTSELSVENSDQNRRLLEFLVADLKSDWLPSFTHVPAVIRSIAKCLIAVESQDLADLRLVCCPKEDKSNPDGYGRREDETIREVATQCRKLCGAALLNTQNGMDIIDRESNELQGIHGPLSRLLREMLSGNTSERTMMEYVQRAELAHNIILAQQDMLVQGWGNLNSFASDISPALNHQLKTLESRKPELQKQSKSLKEECKKAKAHWVELKEKEDALREEHEDVMERYSSQMKELKSAKLEIRKLSNDIELSELMKKKLEADIKTRKAKLREDKEREQKRRDAMSKETENQSIWSSWWSGEGARRAQVDRDIREQTTTLGEKKQDLKDCTTEVKEWQDKLDFLVKRKGQLEKDASEDSKALADESINEAVIQKRKDAADKAMEKVKELKEKMEGVDAEMAKIRKYETIGQDLSAEFNTMSQHVLYTYSGHRQALIKLKKYDNQLTDTRRMVVNWNRSNVRDAIEDVINLRCHFIVIRFMAQACRAMCHDLYKEGFMAIAHLGTRAGGDASGLQRSDPQHTSAVRDIDRLYRQGELVAQAFDNVKRGVQIGDDRVAVQFKEAQNHIFSSLRYAINDVIDSTPPRSLWVSSASRLRNWTEKSRRKVVGDWAIKVLKPRDEEEEVHELPAETFDKVSELPGQGYRGRIRG